MDRERLEAKEELTQLEALSKMIVRRRPTLFQASIMLDLCCFMSS